MLRINHFIDAIECRFSYSPLHTKESIEPSIIDKVTCPTP